MEGRVCVAALRLERGNHTHCRVGLRSSAIVATQFAGAARRALLESAAGSAGSVGSVVEAVLRRCCQLAAPHLQLNRNLFNKRFFHTVSDGNEQCEYATRE